MPLSQGVQPSVCTGPVQGVQCLCDKALCWAHCRPCAHGALSGSRVKLIAQGNVDGPALGVKERRRIKQRPRLVLLSVVCRCKCLQVCSILLEADADAELAVQHAERPMRLSPWALGLSRGRLSCLGSWVNTSGCYKEGAPSWSGAAVHGEWL